MVLQLVAKAAPVEVWLGAVPAAAQASLEDGALPLHPRALGAAPAGRRVFPSLLEAPH